jgi:4a-hydroxytetrahydrobiopterin dehydratase
MAEYKRLDEAQLQSALSELPDWSIREGKLHREYRFPDFAVAFGFMAIAATHIEKLNHHPEWFNVYGQVVVDLVTHDANGITATDVQLAGIMEEIARKLR